MFYFCRDAIAFNVITPTFLSGCGESKGDVVEGCPQFCHPFGLSAGGHSHKSDVHDSGQTKLTHLLRGLAIHVTILAKDKKEGGGRREKEGDGGREREREGEKE